MSTKTDLAKEIIEKIFPSYLKKQDFFFKNTKITRIDIETDEESAAAEKPKGRYITIEADSVRPPFYTFDEEAFALANEIRALLPDMRKILVIGIGNRELTADSFGIKTAEQLPCGKFFGRELCAFSPGVSGVTGIEPAALIKAAAEKLEPSGIIAADSLCAENLFHICRTIQLSNSGLAPGSGFGKGKKPIDSESMGVPVIALGTPTAAFAEDDSVFVSPNDIDVLIKRASKLAACAIGLAVFPELGIETVREWIC